LQRLIARLAVGYNKRLSDDEASETLALWGDVMQGVPLPELERAVEQLVQEPGQWFPKAGDVRRKALGLTRKLFAPGLTTEHWDRAPWEPGRGPDGEPLLCAQCGGDVTFRRMNDGSYLGHIEHRKTCGQAPRIERPKGAFGMPHASDQERLAKQAERRAGWFQAAADEAKRKAVA
jgi:hypothetical protein